MKKIKYLYLILIAFFITTSCFDDNDDVIYPATNTEIGSFIWKAMNGYYLYQENVADLADDKFGTQNDLNTYVDTFSNPENLFENLIYDRPFTDKFSWIVADYEALEAAFAGITKKNGMNFGFFKDPNSAINKAYGYVRYVTPNTDASNKGVTRGLIFNTIDGIEITYNPTTNQIDAPILNSLRQDSYSIGTANYNGTTVTPTGTNINLVKSVISENPILLSEILNINNTKIGYLLYNQFIGDYDDALNAVFADFKANGVTELVLDLRYNSGGSVHSAITLSSLVTGQFSNQVFSTEQWNGKLQNYFQNNAPERLINNFVTTTRNGQPLNSLNLSRVYIITTKKSASASELVINGLNPYINVVQIGGTTTGKFQASVTLYDSADFTKNNVNLGHKYALQPLVLKSLNSVGFTDYFNGFTPSTNFLLAEDYSNLDVLGNQTEPLLALAICDITGVCRRNISAHKNDLAIDFKNSLIDGVMQNDHKNHPFLSINE